MCVCTIFAECCRFQNGSSLLVLVSHELQFDNSSYCCIMRCEINLFVILLLCCPKLNIQYSEFGKVCTKLSDAMVSIYLWDSDFNGWLHSLEINWNEEVRVWKRSTIATMRSVVSRTKRHFVPFSAQEDLTIVPVWIASTLPIYLKAYFHDFPYLWECTWIWT